jgi:hypothetical protein
MLNTLLEITTVTSVAAYLGYWRVNLNRRRKYAWDLLMAYIEPKAPGQELRRQLCLNEGHSIWEEKWTTSQSTNGLWSMYVNAGIMLDTADSIAQNCTGVDQRLLATLRSDAMQVRASALIALSKHVGSQLSENAVSSAARTATYYADMLTSTAQLLEKNGNELAFGSVGAM